MSSMKMFASTVAVAAAGSAHLKWTDCGDADTFVTIVGLDPEDVALPGKTSLTGSGFLSSDEAGGQFKFTAKAAGIQVLSGGGDLCEETTIQLPDNGGTVVFHALDCPIAAGQVDVKLDLNLLDDSALTNDLINIQISALSSSGDKLLCMAIETNGLSESSSAVDCTKATCQDQCECSLDKCASEINACLAEDNCASSQDCALGCACSDNSCILKCAASSPSLKALPVAKCINANCDGSTALGARAVDCTKATCQAQCECSLDKCASEIDACLAEDNCASSQDCALGCACSDNSCILKCAASSPSLKALPVAKCINANCDGSTATVAV